MNSYFSIFFIIIVKYFFLTNVISSVDIEKNNISQSQYTLEEQEKIIKIHNDLRSGLALGLFGLPEGSNIQQMSYDLILESYAKSHTDKCDFKLSDIEEYGENIFKTNSSDVPLNSILLGLNVWWNQINKIHSNVFDPNDGALNFAQMAWSNTNRVGCSVNDCKTFKLVLCYYHPRGNIDKSNIYEVGSYCKNDNDCINVNNGSCIIGKGLCSLMSDTKLTNKSDYNSDEVEITLNSNLNPPENSISFGNISGGLISSVQNGINDATSLIKNTSTDLVSQLQNGANNLLGGAKDLIGNVGQTVGNTANNLINNTNSLLNGSGINLNGTFLGSIPGYFNGAISSLLNGTGNLQQTINNITGVSVNITNDGDSNLLNTTSNINNLLNNTTTQSSLLLNGSIESSSGTIAPTINTTISLLTTTEIPLDILNTTNGIGSLIPSTTIVEGLLNTTTNDLLISTTSIITNETNFSGTTSISPILNVTLSTEVGNISSSLTSPVTTMSSIQTTTCEWGVICKSSENVTNQILANVVTITPNISNSTSSSGGNNCTDLRENCNIMVLFCSFSMYQPFMFSTCPKTCQQC